MGLNRLRLQAILSSQARKRDLPYLCELEYLESTGEQFITIPYKIVTTDTFRHETANQYTKFGTNQYEGQTSGGNWYGINGSGKYTIGSGVVSSFTASTTDFDNIVADSNETGLTLIVNGNIVGTRSSKSSGQKVYIFDCYNPNATATGNYYNFVRKKYHKLYVNGSLFFDGIPVLDYDMKPAMYDRVTKTFFYNEGTGADFKWAIKKGDTRAYTEIEYLESTGKQQITLDFSVTATDNFRHETEQLYTKTSGDQLEGNATGGGWFGCRSGVYKPSSTDVVPSTSNYDKIIYESIENRSKLTVNGTQLGDAFVKVEATGFRIFNAYSTYSTSYYCYVRKKYHKFYINDVLVFDGIPVLDYLLRPAMFDRVSGKFFYNEGTGADFKYGLRGTDGNLYTSVPYIESTGVQWINLNKQLEPTDNVRHETSIMVTQTGTIQREGYAIAARWYGISENGHYTLGSDNSTILASTTDYDNIVLNSVSDGSKATATLFVNDEQVLQRYVVIKVTTSTCLFTGSISGAASCYFRKKYHKFYVNNKPYFIGIPVINADGKPAMFDIVTKKPFYNDGTGTDFIVGE